MAEMQTDTRVQQVDLGARLQTPEVSTGQMTQDRGIDVIFGKAFSLFGHAERFEPIRNLLHRSHVACTSGSAAPRGQFPRGPNVLALPSGHRQKGDRINLSQCVN
jgi:hypothetical protein